MGGPRARPPWAPARALPAEVHVHVQTWLRRYPWLPNYIMCIHNIIIWSVLMTSKSQTFYSSIWCRVHSCLQLLILHRCFVGKLRRALWVANGAISLAVIQCVITHLFWHFIYAAVAIYPSFTTLRLRQNINTILFSWDVVKSSTVALPLVFVWPASCNW